MKLSNALIRSILYAASTFYMKGISLFMIPFVVHYLHAEEYGRLEYIGSFAILLSVIVAFGLEDALYRYVGQQKNNALATKIAGEIYGLVIIIGLLFLISSLIFLWVFDIISHAIIYLCTLLVLTLSLEGIISIPLGWMRIKDHFKLYCSINIIRASVQALLLTVFLSLERGVEGVFEAGLISTLLTAISCAIYQIKSTGIAFIHINILKYLRYSIPIMTSGFLAFLLNGFDKWVLVEYTSLTDLAYYAIATKFSIALSILMQPYGMWWSPLRFSLINSEDNNKIVSRYAIYGLLQIVFFSLIIGLFAPIIIITLFPPEFTNCIWLIAPLLAIFSIKESAEFLNIGCFTTDSTSAQMKITFVSTSIGVISMLVLTPLFGLSGLVFCLFTSQLSRTLILFIYAQKIVKLSIPHYKLSLLMITSFTLIAITNLSFTQNILDPISLMSMVKNHLGIWFLSIFIITSTTLILFYENLPINNLLNKIKSVYSQACRNIIGFAP